MIQKIKNFIFYILASIMTVWTVAPSLLLFLYAIIQAGLTFGLGGEVIKNLPMIFQITPELRVSVSGVLMFIIWVIVFFAGVIGLNCAIKYCKLLWQKESTVEEAVLSFIINQLPLSLLVILGSCNYLLEIESNTQIAINILGGILGGIIVMAFLEFLIIIPVILFIWFVIRSLLSLILSVFELFNVDTSGFKQTLGGFTFIGGVLTVYGGTLLGVLSSAFDNSHMSNSSSNSNNSSSERDTRERMERDTRERMERERMERERMERERYEISYIEQRGGTVYCYNRSRQLVLSRFGKLVGYTGNSVTINQNGVYHTYDGHGRLVK